MTLLCSHPCAKMLPHSQRRFEVALAPQGPRRTGVCTGHWAHRGGLGCGRSVPGAAGEPDDAHLARFGLEVTIWALGPHSARPAWPPVRIGYWNPASAAQSQHPSRHTCLVWRQSSPNAARGRRRAHDLLDTGIRGALCACGHPSQPKERWVGLAVFRRRRRSADCAGYPGDCVGLWSCRHAATVWPATGRLGDCGCCGLAVSGFADSLAACL